MPTDGRRPAPREAPGASDASQTSDAAGADRYRLPLVAFLLIACGVAVSLGVYGREHEPAGYALNVPGFSGPLFVKAWLATGAAVLGIVQLLSAARLYDSGASLRTARLHRWSGRIAVLLTVPVAVHCLYSLGFQSGSPRVLVHSLVGCLFFGAFVAKMLVLTRRDRPRWVLPVLGGLLFTALTALWLTSSLWVFTTLRLGF